MNSKIWYMIAALGLICMLAGPASALVITSDKHALKSGEIVTLNVTGMTNGTSFTMKVTNDQQMSTLPSAFGNSNLTLPNAVDWDNFTVSMTNTTENSVIVDDYPLGEGVSHELIFNGTSKDNLFSRNHTLDTFEGGAVSANWVATPVAGATNVTSSFELNGTKIGGPDTFEMSTSGYSAHPATITVEITANGTLAYQDTFTLGQGVLPAVIPTLIPGGYSGSDSYTGVTATIKPAVNNTTANLTANVTGVATITTPVAMTTSKFGEPPAAGLNLAGTNAGMNTTNATTTTQPAGAPFALVTLIGLGLACLVVRSRR